MIFSSARRPKHSCACQKNASFGFTLIEVVAVISLSAVLTGTAIATIASLFRFDVHISKHVEERNELLRLSDSVRVDIRQAISMEWDKSDQVLNLELPTQQNIRYQVSEGRWIRIAGLQGAPKKQSSYLLSESYQCFCEPPTASQGITVRIKFESKRDLENDPDSLLRAELQSEIVATIGRDFDLLSE